MSYNKLVKEAIRLVEKHVGKLPRGWKIEVKFTTRGLAGLDIEEWENGGIIKVRVNKKMKPKTQLKWLFHEIGEGTIIARAGGLKSKEARYGLAHRKIMKIQKQLFG